MVVESPSGGLLPVMPEATDTTNNMLAFSGPCGIKCIVKPFSDMLFLEHFFYEVHKWFCVHHDNIIFHQCANASVKRVFDDLKYSSAL